MGKRARRASAGRASAHATQICTLPDGFLPAVCSEAARPLWSAPDRPRPAARRALHEDTVPDIFDEVDEDLRADRMRDLFKKYGGAMVAAALLVVAASGAWQFWQKYEARHVADVAQAFLNGMRVADSPAGAGRQEALAQFDAVQKKGRSGYRLLARLRAAAVKADTGDLAGASALWDQVAGDASADPLLRDLANLQWALHRVDSGDAAAVEARLKPLASPENPWHALAREQLVLLDLRLGKTDTARDALKQLAQDVTAPDGVRDRANGLLAQLGG